MSEQWSAGDLNIAGSARTALELFVTQALDHPAIEGMLLYGSSLWKSDPADFDFVIMLDKPDEYLHFYAVHPALDRRCEVEYLTPPVLEEYLTHAHWHVQNWELDLGAKYINGQVLLDRQNRLSSFRERLSGPAALPVRRYLFTHNYGQATSRLSKLAKCANDDPALDGLCQDFSQSFNRAAYHARLTYPWQPFLLDGWPLSEAEKASLTRPGQLEAKQVLLDQIVKAAVINLEIEALLADCTNGADLLAKIPLYHLVDYTGLSEIVGRVRPELALPPEVYFSLFNA